MRDVVIEVAPGRFTIADVPSIDGATLTTWRARLGLRQRDVAALVGAHVFLVGKWERNQRPIPEIWQDRLRAVLREAVRDGE